MIRRSAAAVLALLAAVPAIAQEAGSEQTYFDRPNRVTIGVGAAYMPSYDGSDDYVASPIAGAFGKIGGFSFTTRGTGVSIDLIRENSDRRLSFQLGPAANLRFDRSGRVSDRRVAALGKIRRAIELGGSVGINVHHLLDPYDSLGLHLIYVHDVAGAHGSAILSPSLSYTTPLSLHEVVQLSAQLDHVGGGYARTYFSVTPAGSLRSGLPVYDAHVGWKTARLSLLLGHAITGDLRHPRLSLFTGLGFARELGNFARSPIVAIAGSRDQYMATAGLAYSF